METQMLAQHPDRKPCKQAKTFADLALAHYNEKKKTVRINLLGLVISFSIALNYLTYS
jgi:hypothetical protein